MSWLTSWSCAYYSLRTDDFEAAAISMKEVLTDPELPHFLVPLAKQEWETYSEVAKAPKLKPLVRFSMWLTDDERFWNRKKVNA